MEEKISLVNAHGEKLAGIKTTPQIKHRPLPAVLLVHGFGVTKEEGGMFDELAAHLSSYGIIVFRFDFSGRGQSEGDYFETSLTKQKEELKLMLEIIQSDKSVDPKKIGILAQSFGTCSTIALAPEVNTIILMGSLAHPSELLAQPAKWEKFDPDGISRKTKSSGEVINIGSQFWSDVKNYNLTKSISKISCPILFIHGSEDKSVPTSEMETLFKNAQNPKKIILEGAEHNFKPKREEMYSIVINWFQGHLTQPR